MEAKSLPVFRCNGEHRRYDLVPHCKTYAGTSTGYDLKRYFGGRRCKTVTDEDRKIHFHVRLIRSDFSFIAMTKQHLFQETSFARPTYCQQCKGLLWGLRNQGVQCEGNFRHRSRPSKVPTIEQILVTGCQYICHKGCQSKVPSCSRLATVASNGRHSSSTSTTLADRADFQAHQPQNAKGTPNHQGIKSLPGASRTEQIESIIISAAVDACDSADPPNEYLANLPPLHPQISAKNFARFASRCGPMFTFRDSVILLLSWEKPIDTLVAMIIYCMICK